MFTNRELPVLQGRDLLDVASQGMLLGKLVNRAYEIQIEQGITDKAQLRARVLQEFELVDE